MESHGEPPLAAERMGLEDEDVAYLVGRGGATRARLENFSGARLNIDRDSAEISGTSEERALVKLAIKITLQQRQHGTVSVSFEEIESRGDVSTMDVPVETVGFLLGSKGGTLRDIETRHHTFMFFDNHHVRNSGKSGDCKRLYVIGREADRTTALDEAEDIVMFKKTGQGAGPRRLRPETGHGAPTQRDQYGGLMPRREPREPRDMPPRGEPPRGEPPPPRHGGRDMGPPPPQHGGGGPPPRFVDDRDRERDRFGDRGGPPHPSSYGGHGPSSSSSSYGGERDPRDAPPPPRYDERDGYVPPPPRYDERPPPPRFDERERERDGYAPPPPRYDERGAPPPQQPPPPHSSSGGYRYDERERSAPPPHQQQPPRYDERPPPPRYDERERDYYHDRAPAPPARYDDRDRYDSYYDRRGPPPAQQAAPPPRYDERGAPPPRYDDRYGGGGGSSGAPPPPSYAQRPRGPTDEARYDARGGNGGHQYQQQPPPPRNPQPRYDERYEARGHHMSSRAGASSSHRSRGDTASGSEASCSGSEGDDASWVSWFCSLKGNEFFVEVDHEFMQDDFNMTGLSAQVPYYEYALDTILDSESSTAARFSKEQQEQVESAAELLYGLIHARYIITPRGMQAMLEKYKLVHFGRCPRVHCQGQPALPVGQSDLPRMHTTKIYCCRCEDIYYPRSSRQANVDGAYFGTTFCHLFLQTYWEMKPKAVDQVYTPRIFGFKIHRPQAPPTISAGRTAAAEVAQQRSAQARRGGSSGGGGTSRRGEQPGGGAPVAVDEEMAQGGGGGGHAQQSASSSRP